MTPKKVKCSLCNGCGDWSPNSDDWPMASADCPACHGTGKIVPDAPMQAFIAQMQKMASGGPERGKGE